MNRKKVAVLADCEIEEIQSFIDGFTNVYDCDLTPISQINNGSRGGVKIY